MMRDKLTKFLAVAFLTLLIWTWAFLSQEEVRVFSGVLEISPATDQALLVTFWAAGNELGQKVNLELKFKGPPAKISELLRQTEQATPNCPQRDRLTYYYNPRDFGHTQSQFYQFNLLDFLQKSSHAKGLALTLESASINQEPISQIQVDIEVLVQKQLSVECLSETGLPVKNAVAEPAQVEMHVGDNYNGPAYVTLSAAQIEQAQQRGIRLRPFVEMGIGVRRRAPQEVTVRVPRDTQVLPPRVFQPQPQNIGFVFNQNLQGKYIARIDPESESKLRTINLRATDEAWEAFRRMRYPLLIEIRDEDVLNLSTELPPKEVIYNFPKEFVTRREIELGEPRPPQTVTIRIEPAAPAPVTP